MAEKYIVIDTETTGLDFDKHEVIAFGGMVLIDGVVTDSLEVYCHPDHIGRADSKALEVNGYTPKARLWKYAVSREAAILQIVFFLRSHLDGTLVGHNVNFDIQFLKRFAERESLKRRRSDVNERIDIVFPKPYLDTRDVSRATLGPYGLESMSLDNICQFVGWKRRRAHTALSDCEDCIRLLRALVPPSPRFILRLKTLRTIRKIKGLLS